MLFRLIHGKLIKKLKNCVNQKSYADYLRKDGRVWLIDVLHRYEGEDMSEILDEASNFDELFLLWGYINYNRGFVDGKKSINTMNKKVEYIR